MNFTKISGRHMEYGKKNKESFVLYQNLFICSFFKLSPTLAGSMKFFGDKDFLRMNFYLKNGCKNDFKDNNEKS